MIQVKCPQCGKGLQVDDKYAGKTGNCLHCKQKIKVPSGNVWKDEIGMEAVPQIGAQSKDSAFAGPYPSPPKLATKKKYRTRAVVLGVIASLVFIAFVDAKLNYESRSKSSAGAQNGAKASKPVEKDRGIDARIYSQHFVEQRLVSPGSAKFPWGGGKSTKIGPNQYKVVSYVDSQNRFGAMIRNNYQCTMTYDPVRKGWTCSDLSITGR